MFSDEELELIEESLTIFYDYVKNEMTQAEERLWSSVVEKVDRLLNG